MCVIIVAKSSRPDAETIKLCHESNPHGIGLAYRGDNGLIEYSKGHSPEFVNSIINDLPLPFVLHFRLASAGNADDKTLNHPFPVTVTATPAIEGKCARVLFHNGHIGSWESLLFSYLNSAANRHKYIGPWSDTRLAAIMAAKHGADALPGLFPGQKFVLFDSKSLVTIGLEREDNGMKFSNYYWKKSTSGYQTGVWPGVKTYARELKNLPARYKRGGMFLNPDWNDTDFPVK